MTARQILTAQVAQLRAAMAIGTDPCALTHAFRLLTRSQAALEQVTRAPLSWSAGTVGENGWQASVDDVCRQLTWRRAPNASLDGCDVSVVEAEQHREIARRAA